MTYEFHHTVPGSMGEDIPLLVKFTVRPERCQSGKDGDIDFVSVEEIMDAVGRFWLGVRTADYWHRVTEAQWHELTDKAWEHYCNRSEP